MSSSFEINGKKYLPSSLLATDFGYTTDYIGKLAREEKILGTLIGRQWFIEPESLKTFSLKSQVEKEIRKSELSEKRKREHGVRVLTESKRNVAVPSPTISILKTVSIFACISFVTGLSFLIQNEELDSTALVFGAKAVSSSIVQTAPSVNEFVSAPAQVTDLLKEFVYAEKTQQALLVEKAEIVSLEKRESGVHEVFAKLPVQQLPDTISIAVAATNTPVRLTKSLDIQNSFSDEVTFVADENGEELIAPIFKDQSNSAFFYRLVPVSVVQE